MGTEVRYEFMIRKEEAAGRGAWPQRTVTVTALPTAE